MIKKYEDGFDRTVEKNGKFTTKWFIFYNCRCWVVTTKTGLTSLFSGVAQSESSSGLFMTLAQRKIRQVLSNFFTIILLYE